MSHELTFRKNGQVEHAYVGAAGWTGLGTQLQAGATIEQWAAAAGMDWTVEHASVQYDVSKGSNEQHLIWTDRKVQYRSDTHAPLGVVSASFKTVQPGEALEFFRDLVDLPLETAGTLKGGKKYWAMAKVGEAEIAKGDLVKAYLLMATACDGSMGTVVQNVSTRVVCNNTLGYALSENGKSFKLSHRSTFDATKVKQYLGLRGAQSFESFITTARRLAEREISRDGSAEFVAKLVGQDLTGVGTRDWAPSKAFTTIVELFDGQGMGSKLQGSEGTLWGMVNAVTEYVDHHVKARSDDNRIDSAWFGPGATLKARAMAMAEELIAA